MSLFICKCQTKTTQPTHCYVLGNTLKISLLFSEMEKTPSSLHFNKAAALLLSCYDTSLSGRCLLLSRPDYDRLRCFLLCCLCVHSTLLAEAATRGITVQPIRDAGGNSSTPLANLPSLFTNGKKPTNTFFLPKLAGKVFRYVIHF